MTHEEVQEYLDQLGFDSEGAAMFNSEEYLETNVTKDQLAYYALNDKLIVQVEDVIMKVKDDSLALAMRSDYLSNSSYENISEGYYDSTRMNLFAENPSSTETEWGIVDYTHETPSGYEQSRPNTNHSAQIFGKRYDVNANEDCCYNNHVWHFNFYTTHFFFVRTGSGYDAEDMGAGCSGYGACSNDLVRYI